MVSGAGGGAEMTDCDGPQFPPPIDGLYGFGPGRCTSGLPGLNCSLQEYEYCKKAMLAELLRLNY